MFLGMKKGTIDQADQVVDRWEQVKAEEKQQKGDDVENDSIFKKCPSRLPACFMLMIFTNGQRKRIEVKKLQSTGTK